MNLKSSFLVVLTLFAVIPSLKAANILGLMGIPSPSHHNWNRNIFLELAKKGHNLTILSPDIDKEVTPNIYYIWAENAYNTLYNTNESVNILDFAHESPFSSVVSVWGAWGHLACKGLVTSKGFKVLLNYPDSFKFDLVLFDFTAGPCLSGFIHKFKYPPVIGLTAFSVPSYIYQYLSGHTQPAYVPHYTVEFDKNMNFIQRLENYLVLLWDKLYQEYKYLPRQNELMQSAFNIPDLPYVTELQKTMALALVGTHFSYETVEPLPANIIPVGGLQIRDPQPLDEKIRDFVEASKKGAVLFSLGTNVRSEFMSLEKKKMFLAAFEKFPDYHFLWKYESDIGLSLPKNVVIQPWLKQNDILAHPKTKAFISHCGLLSTTESIWYGVPVIGIPFLIDQFRNLRIGINAGSSVMVSYQTLTQQDIENALKEVLTKPLYKKNAEKRSSLLRDQIDKPLDRAIFWCEWLMRHATDYKEIQLSRINELGCLAANSYDILIFFGAVILTLYILIQKITSKIFKTNDKKKRD